MIVPVRAHHRRTRHRGVVRVAPHLRDVQSAARSVRADEEQLALPWARSGAGPGGEVGSRQPPREETMQIVDGYGAPVRLIVRRTVPMAQAVARSRGLVGAVTWERLGKAVPANVGPQQTWRECGYDVELRARGELGVVTIRHASLPLPFHLLVVGLGKARRAARGAVAAFRAGRAPPEGVFRAMTIEAG